MWGVEYVAESDVMDHGKCSLSARFHTDLPQLLHRHFPGPRLSVATKPAPPPSPLPLHPLRTRPRLYRAFPRL